MTFKKVLAALGLVCLIAPAALAAAGMMARPGSNLSDKVPDGALHQLIASLQEIIEGRGNIGEGYVSKGLAPHVDRLPFRKGNSLPPELSGLIWKLDYKQASMFAEGAAPGAGGAVPGTAGPTGTQQGAAASGEAMDGVPSAGGFGGSLSGSGNGGFGLSGGHGRGSANATDLALAAIEETPPADDGAGGASGDNLAVMPLPASVWMLLASMVGLAFIGIRRRSLH